MIQFVIGIVVGCCVGVFSMCILVTGKRADEAMEEETKRLPVLQLPDKRACIRFCNSRNQELFCIPDGGSIVLVSGDGDMYVSLCRYLDENHVSVDGQEWQMQEFAKQMEKRGIQYSPLWERYERR